jgi:hypothetical protein
MHVGVAEFWMIMSCLIMTCFAMEFLMVGAAGRARWQTKANHRWSGFHVAGIVCGIDCQVQETA